MRKRARFPRLAWLAAVLFVGSAASAAAQTPFYPYFGKNNIHYDTFDWHIYTTDHFEIYYYPEIEQHLERIASYAESAYQQISADLKHDLSSKISVVLFKTHSEFEQQNIEPSAAQEGVLAFAEPYRDRMVLPIDSPPDLLYGLIVHELTHQFQFDIIPQGLVQRNYPLWVGEGQSEWERGQWMPIDLMTVRDAAISDTVPKMTETDGYGNAANPRLVPYNLGHAVFEFIEAKYGKEGVRTFMFALRKSVIGGGEDAYEEAFHMKKEEFDQAFERYLKERFKPFRDKEQPADYGLNLAPNPEKGQFIAALSIAASPSGELLATVTVNRKDGELDIVLLSAKDGSMVRNLTSGFDKGFGFDHIVYMGDRPDMPWMSWSPKGDRLAYFVRTEKERTLIVQNVLTRKVEVRVPMKSVDEPESPTFSPDGRLVAFAGLRGGIGDIYTVDLETQQITNLTGDEFADYGPTYAPDGRSVLYATRVSGNYKLFRLNLDTGTKTQLTFGTHDDSSPQFIDAHTIAFSSTAVDPLVPLDPEVAKNGNIFNIWTLDFDTGTLAQLTDTLGGNTSPVVLNEGNTKRIAFITYYKGNTEIHTLDKKEPLRTVASSDFGAPGDIIDFQPPLTHTIVPANERRKTSFEKMFLEGRPPVAVGVTSSGDVFGGTSITFGDVLGDKQFNIFVSSISQYRTIQGTFVNLSRRLQWAVTAQMATEFYYAQTNNLFYDPAYAGIISRDDAVATRTVRGGSVIGSYPLNRYRRLEVSGGLLQLDEQYANEALQQYSTQEYGQSVFRNGILMPLSVAYISETTVFREFGPLSGSTMRLAYDVSPGFGGMLSRQTFDVDARYYQRLASTGVLAFRFKGFKSTGDFPDYTYFGGNSEMRGYEYLQFLGQNAVFANAELRFPLIEAALTPIGVLGGVRGVFFANIGGGWFDNTGYVFATGDPEIYTPQYGYQYDPVSGAILIDPATGLPLVQEGTPVVINDFRLRDGRASYGMGLETFALGFPIHFDWAWRTTFSKKWEDALFAPAGGSNAFRKVQFSIWIGYDF